MNGEDKRSTNAAPAGDDPPDTIHAHYEWSQTSPVEAIIELVGDATNQDPATLDPLYDHVEPEALTTLLTTTNGDQAPAVQIELTYAGYEVTLRRNGDLSLHLD